MVELSLPSGVESLSDAVVEAISGGIRSGQLSPQRTYSVYQLADALGISRSPVREGLLRLAEAGLVRIDRNRGFRVLLPGAHDVEEIIDIRLALEPLAARRAAERGDDEELVGVRDAFTAMRVATTEEEFWVADQTLHDLLLRAGGNNRAAAVVARLRATTALLGPPTTAVGRTLAQIRDEHAPIVEAVLARDGVTAEQAMRAHLEHTRDLLVRSLRR